MKVSEKECYNVGHTNQKESYMEIVSQLQIEKSVVIKGAEAVVSSDKVAKVFDKQHKHVLDAISRKIKDLEAIGISGRKVGRFFIDETVQRERGVGRRVWMTRKGFDLIALSFTGKKALAFKLWYIEAFHEREQLIQRHKITQELHYQDLEWRELREAGKLERLSLTDAINETVVKHRESVEGKVNDGKYFYHYTMLIYKHLGIDIPRGVPVRDTLSKTELHKVEELEKKVAGWIMEYYEKGVYYKDTYKKIKARLEAEDVD